MNSSLNEEIAKKGLILSNAKWSTMLQESQIIYAASLSNKYENFKTAAAKKALTEAASALREQIG